MKRILIVDDEQDLLYIIKLLLTFKGFDVITHDSGYGVPGIVKKTKPDLILLDIRLPGKSGTEICKELKEISNLPSIILFSAHAREMEVLADCKADGFISKPFDLNYFIEMVEQHTMDFIAPF